MIKKLAFLLILLLSIPSTVTSQVLPPFFSEDWDANGNDGNGGVSNAMKELYPDSFKDQMSQYDYCIILFNNRRGTINKHINGQKNGLWINIEKFDLFYLSEENYKDGKLDGNCNYYYKDGQLAKEENYTNGVLDGSYKYYYYRIGKLRFIKNYKEGKQDGQYKRWYKDGRLMYETEFINGTGIDKLYSENGKLVSEVNYINGDKVSFSRWFTNGNLELSFNYKDGKKDGICKLFYNNGDLKIESYYSNNNLNSQIKYSQNGNCKSYENYNNGTLNGNCKYYYENGQLKDEINFNNNIRHGQYKKWYKDGRLMYETEFDNGTGVNKNYYESGQLAAIQNFKNGNRDGNCKYYYKNGQLKYDENFKNGNRDGNCKYYYENGRKECWCNYTNEQKNGLRKFWYENGKLKSHENYNNGTLNGNCKYYYENGKLKSYETYNNGTLNGNCKYYYENGQLEYEENYHNGELEAAFDLGAIKLTFWSIEDRIGCDADFNDLMKKINDTLYIISENFAIGYGSEFKVTSKRNIKVYESVLYDYSCCFSETEGVVYFDDSTFNMKNKFLTKRKMIEPKDNLYQVSDTLPIIIENPDLINWEYKDDISEDILISVFRRKPQTDLDDIRDKRDISLAKRATIYKLKEKNKKSITVVFLELIGECN